MSFRAILVALVASSGIVSGQTQDDHMNVYREKGCRTDSAAASIHKLRFPNPGGGETCQTSMTKLKDWPTNENGDYIVYYDGMGIGKGCTMALLDDPARGTQFCGNPLVVISGDANVGTCRSLALPPDYGVARCCPGETCQPVIPPITNGRRSVSSKDVTQIKRSSPFDSKPKVRRDDCTFSGGDSYNSRGRPETITAVIKCGDATGCSFMRSDAVTKGTSNTFGVSQSVGGSLFKIIEESTTFSYDYSFSESHTETNAYTVAAPANSSGVVVFTQYTECTTGTFSGSCPDGIPTGQEGDACIPVQGMPGGEYRFVVQA